MADMDKNPDATRLIDVIQRRAKLLDEIEQAATVSSAIGTGSGPNAAVDAELYGALKELLEYMRGASEADAREVERQVSGFMDLSGFMDTNFHH
jgi:hypothetical protein